MSTGQGHPTEPAALSEFQVEVAQFFFSLRGAEPFLLAGGGALLAQRMSQRPTHDLDFFTGVHGAVDAVAGEFQAAAVGRGWAVEIRRGSETFCRLVVHGSEDLLVDIALDSRPLRPAAPSLAGPTFAPEELAGRKMLALFDRAEARDFVDVRTLADKYSRTQLLGWAEELDRGFDRAILADQFRSLARFADVDLPISPSRVAELRRYFADWVVDLVGRK